MVLILKSKFHVWLILSILVAILFGCAGLKFSFESVYTIQDDARQHIFWMQQFRDSELFQNDLIAEYFKSVSPWGFTALYKIINFLGIDIFWFNKISPLLIGIVTTIYCFLVCVELIPVPIAGFFSSLLLNQNLWMLDDLSSGTPRAFIYVLLLAFIYYLLKENTLLAALIIFLQGLFYPQAVLLSVMILLINCIRVRKIKTIHFWCLLTATIVLGFYAFKISDFGNIISVNQAQGLPEFYEGGRSTFFHESWIKFWLTGRRSGLFPIEWQYILMSSYGIFILWLPAFPKTFPLTQKLNSKILILKDILLASIIMFILAHLLLFQLHLPGRYTQHTIRIIIALVDGIVISIVINAISRKINQALKGSYNLCKIAVLALLICLLLYPTYAVQSYPRRLGYFTGNSPQLYQFLEQQPKDSLIASLSQEADFIPSLTGRSVLVAREYAIPYHQGYYRKFRHRVQDLITAQYSLDITTIRNFIQKYNIDLWLLDKNAFEVEYLSSNSWLMQFEKVTNKAINILEKNQQPLLQKSLDMTEGMLIDSMGNQVILDRCTVFNQDNLVLLSAKCLL